MSLIKISLGLLAAACLLVAAPAPLHAAEKQRLSIATGGTGGVYYPYGGGLARIWSAKIPNTEVTAEVTGGSVDNVKLLGAREADIGFSTVDSAVDGLKGEGAYKDTGPQKVAQIARLYDSYVHIVARADTKISSLEQLKGKRVSVGSAGSSTEGIADRVLEAAGLDPKKDVTRENLGVSESVAGLKDGKIDAFFWIGGLPTAAVTDLATTGNTNIVFLSADKALAKLQQKYPGLYTGLTLPKTTYPGMATDVAGIGVANLLLVTADAPAPLVEGLLKATFDNLADVHKIHPEATKLKLDSAAAKTAVPSHPAAEAFYKARGVK